MKKASRKLTAPASSAEPFPGFPKESITFLRALKRNNDRDWFQANKRRYEEFVKTPSLAFVEALRPELRKLYPHVQVTRKAMSRIYRDTRFSADKTPYKTWVMFGFEDARNKHESELGFYLGYDWTGIAYGCGIWGMTSAQRDKFRERVTDPVHGREFTRIVRALRAKGEFKLEGKELKRIPPGYDPKHPNAEFLLYNWIYAVGERDMPAEFYRPSFPRYLAKRYAPLKPFYQWITELALASPRPLARFLEGGAEMDERTARDMDLDDAPAWG